MSFPAALVDRHGTVVPQAEPVTSGHGWSSAGLLLDSRVAGAAPQGEHEVALGVDLAAVAQVTPGDQVQVVASGRTGTYRVSAVVGAGAGILVPDAVAGRLAGRVHGPRAGTVDLVGLRVHHGATDAVRDAVRHRVAAAGLVVSTGSSRGDVLLPAAAASRSLLVVLAGSLGGVPLLVVGFVIANALSVSIAGQRRELALLRAVGMTPRQVRNTVASQASIVAAAALVPAVALGYLLAGQFRRLLVATGLLPDGVPLTVSPLPALAAAAVLLLVVQVAARCAAWRTSREPVTVTLGDARTGSRLPSRTRSLVGLVVLVAALPLALTPLLTPTAVGAASTSLAGIVSAIGLVLIGPALLPRLTARLVRALPTPAGAPTWLATASLHGYALRSAGAVTTLATAVVVVLTYTLSQTTLTAAVDRDVQAGTRADAVITAQAGGGAPEGLLQEVRATPGVQAAAASNSTSIVWPTRMFGEESAEAQPATVLDPAAGDLLDLGVRDGTLADLTGSTVAVSHDGARSHSVEVGSRVHLVLRDGAKANTRVVAVYDRSLGFGPLVLSADLAAGHLNGGLAERLLVRTDRSAPTLRALTALVGARPGAALAADGGSGAGQRVAPEFWVNVAVLGVLLGYLLLGVLNALVAAATQRRSEIAALRLVGMMPAQVRAMVRREAALVSVAAVLSGVLVSAVPLAVLGVGFLGRPWAAGPAWLLPATVTVVAAIALGSSTIPTRAALRLPASEAAHAS